MESTRFWEFGVIFHKKKRKGFLFTEIQDSKD